MNKLFVYLVFVLYVFLSGSALACLPAEGGLTPSFIERVGPALNLTDRDRANGFYVKFSGSIDQLNELVNEGRARSTEGQGKELVYRTLTKAQAASDRRTSYLIGVGIDGEVSGVWTPKGEPLGSYKYKSMSCGGTTYLPSY